MSNYSCVDRPHQWEHKIVPVLSTAWSSVCCRASNLPSQTQITRQAETRRKGLEGRWCGFFLCKEKLYHWNLFSILWISYCIYILGMLPFEPSEECVHFEVLLFQKAGCSTEKGGGLRYNSQARKEMFSVRDANQPGKAWFGLHMSYHALDNVFQ